MLPVDRMRRFVTPVDIDGSGRALRWGVPWPAGDVGADELRAGRLRRLFPTPRRPGAHQRRTRRRGDTRHDRLSLGQHDLFYTSGPNPANLTFPSYLPDVTNNPLHGFEAAKNPNLPGGYAPQDNGGMPADENVAEGIPDAYPTYDLSIRTNGLNEADEMNLYRPNALLDSPYGPTDLEWLYRSQDVDGPSLLSRLADLAPVSFTNTIDGQRRRRLFAVESWELNNFVWTNDNPAWPTRIRRPTGHDCRRLRPMPRSPSCERDSRISGPLTVAVPPRPGPSRQEDQPQLPPAGLERPRRADPAEVDHRHVSAPQVGPAPPGRRYSGRAGPAQPVRDQHHRFPRPGLHDDPLAEPGRPARAGTARESLGQARRRPRRPPRWSWPPPTRPTPSPWTSTAWSTTRSPSTRCSRSLTRTTRAAARRPTGSSSSSSTR